ncbi:MAG: VTT domain-containing protein [Rhodoluna sp.]|nr:VTT domain-containing protein [Rhodoluna sp.]
MIDLSFLNTLGPLGLLVACLMVFAETGLLIGFFLPGDSLLFLVGLNLGSIWQDVPIWFACLAISLSGLAGDQTGYWIGRRLGPAVFTRPNSKFFSHKNVERAHSFFERYGSKAVILAHFVPVMRTFVPVAAGVGEMSWRKFTTYNVIGVLGWGTGVTLLGYFLGGIKFISDHVTYVTLVFIALSFIPLALEVLRTLRNKKRG